MNKLIGFIFVFLSLIILFFLPRPTNAATNLIYNPSVETASPTNPSLPDGWFTSSYGTNMPVFLYPVPGYDGIKAIQVQFFSYTNGDAKWYFQNVAVLPNQQYTYSDYYTSNISSDLSVRYTLSDGSTSYQYLGTVGPSSTWKQDQFTFTTPSNAVSLTVLHLIYSVGSLTTDKFSLTALSPPSPTPTPTMTPTPTPTPSVTPTPSPSSSPTPTPSPSTTPTPTPSPSVSPTPTPSPSGNLISNPSLEQMSLTGQPVGWTTSKSGFNNAFFSYPVPGYGGGRAARIDILWFNSGSAQWMFTDVPVTPGATYSFSDSYQSNANTEVDIRYRNTDGSYSYVYMGGIAVSPNSWSTAKETFTVPPGVQSVTVFHALVGTGYLIVDNFVLQNNDSITKFNQGMVSLDFDDGTISAFQIGIPILNTAGFKSTQYIITGNVNTDPDTVTTADILQMQSQGHDIQNHTQTHPDLTTLTSSQVTQQIQGATTDLLNMGVTKVTSLAIPFGSYNSTTLSLIRQTGLSASRTTDQGYNYKNSDHYTLKSFSLDNTATVGQIESYINTAVQNQAWVIIVFHEVDTGSQFSITHQNLQAVVDYLKQNNVSIVTVDQGLSRMSP